ncbi:MAG: ATP-binding protein [Mycoplasmatales bacterium]
MKEYNFSYFKNQKIINFIEENNLKQDDVLPFVAEIKMYLEDPDKYKLTWDDMVVLESYRIESNPGLVYLEENFFRESIQVKDIDYNKNPVKKQFLSNYDPCQGYYFTGNNGIGKTFLAVALATLHFEKTKEKTLFVFWPDFIEKTKRFSDNNIHYINKVKYAKRLIIDDLGLESITSWSRDDILNSIIAFRLEKKLHTIITSNYYQRELTGVYTLREIEAKKAKSIANKITGLTSEIPLCGKDLRNDIDA